MRLFSLACLVTLEVVVPHKLDIEEQIRLGHQQSECVENRFCQRFWHGILIQHMMVVLFEYTKDEIKGRIFKEM